MTLDSTHTAVVDPDYYWRPMHDCPVGSKVQLLNMGGVAIYGTTTERNRHEYLGWAPLPKKRPA